MLTLNYASSPSLCCVCSRLDSFTLQWSPYGGSRWKELWRWICWW